MGFVFDWISIFARLAAHAAMTKLSLPHTLIPKSEIWTKGQGCLCCFAAGLRLCINQHELFVLAAGASSCPQGFAVDFRLPLGLGVVLQQDVAAVGCAAGDGQGAVLLPCDAGVGLIGRDVETAGVAV